MFLTQEQFDQVEGFASDLVVELDTLRNQGRRRFKVDVVGPWASQVRDLEAMLSAVKIAQEG